MSPRYGTSTTRKCACQPTLAELAVRVPEEWKEIAIHRKKTITIAIRQLVEAGVAEVVVKNRQGIMRNDDFVMILVPVKLVLFKRLTREDLITRKNSNVTIDKIMTIDVMETIITKPAVIKIHATTMHTIAIAADVMAAIMTIVVTGTSKRINDAVETKNLLDFAAVVIVMMVSEHIEKRGREGALRVRVSSEVGIVIITTAMTMTTVV